MPTAEIIIIGTEILLGEIQDTNSHTLARLLRNLGIDLYHITAIGDNPQRIAQAIRQGLTRADILLTTGGLGPTVDDPTRQAVALAIGRDTEFHPELWEQIQERFRRFGRIPTENNRRQAYIPQGAIAIENRVGTAPAFIVELGQQSIISLPGVPSEMNYLMQHEILPYLRRRYNLQGVIKARILHTAGVGESQIDDLIGDLETLTNPTVGLAAHAGQVDVRITAKAETEGEADERIAEVEGLVRQRLGQWIYGVDQETLEEVALRAVQERHWRLVAVESGMAGTLVRLLAKVPSAFQGGEVLNSGLSMEDLQTRTDAYRHRQGVEVGLGASIQPRGESHEVCLVLITPQGVQSSVRLYGGPAEYAPRWATNYALDMVRRIGEKE